MSDDKTTLPPNPPPKPKRVFFVFYFKIPASLRKFLLQVSVLFLVGFVGMGFLLGVTQDDPGRAGYVGGQTLTGVLELDPYPLLRVTEGNDAVPSGRTLMLTGGGKSGIMSRAIPLSEQLVRVSGVLLKRGELDMLQLRGGSRGISSAEGIAPTLPPSESLGRWRVAGEICDGKCLSGAMNPGRGLAHKACANLCLLGGIPPVFVSTRPIEGSEYFLVASSSGGELPLSAYDYIGNFVEIEGEIERRGDLLILKLDEQSIRLLK